MGRAGRSERGDDRGDTRGRTAEPESPVSVYKTPDYELTPKLPWFCRVSGGRVDCFTLQAQFGVTEKVFVSAGRIEMQLGGGSYTIRPASDTHIRVTIERQRRTRARGD